MSKNSVFEIYYKPKHGKDYYVVKKDGKCMWYRKPDGYGKELIWQIDPDTGWPIPTNAVQEYKQSIPKELSKKLRQFKKDFKEYVETYQDLIKINWNEKPGWRSADRLIPLELISTNPEDMHALLKFIKENSFSTKYEQAQKQYVITERPINLKLWLRRIGTRFYDKNEDRLERTKVPLGRTVAKPRYGKDIYRRR